MLVFQVNLLAKLTLGFRKILCKGQLVRFVAACFRKMVLLVLLRLDKRLGYIGKDIMNQSRRLNLVHLNVIVGLWDAILMRGWEINDRLVSV